jgi:hypothetical protein
LAIELGKFNSGFCGLDTATGEAEFRTATTTPNTLHKELTRPVDRVVIESCTPTGWVQDLCGQLGLTCDVANTTQHGMPPPCETGIIELRLRRDSL